MSRKIPKTLGRYEILEELGRGAMGVVYLARDPLIGRLVALKTFRSAYEDGDKELEEFRVRFLREAQSAGILNHPVIVTVHDVVDSSDEEGAIFIAMEYVQGTNLKERLQSLGTLELGRALEIVLQVAEGLAYAHERGVVHRDIKPANILLTREGAPKISDFGIARLDTSDLTQEGQLLGTPNYMAPERILGHEVDHRTDVFSLGVLLYEMLTCHKPFQGDNLTMVTHRIVYEPFTPPERYDASIPLPVVAVLERAMEKKPEDRYSDAASMADDLRFLIESLSTKGRPATSSLSETQDFSGQLDSAEIEAARKRALEKSTDGSDALAQSATGGLKGTSEQQQSSRSDLMSRWSSRPWSRLLLIGLMSAMAGVGLGAMAMVWVNSQQPEIERTSSEALARAHFQPMLQAARQEWGRNRPDLAAKHLERALEIAPQDPILLEFMAAIEGAEAEGQLEAELALRRAWINEATSALDRGDSERADLALERVLAQDPENAEALSLQVMVSEEFERQAQQQARSRPRPRKPPPATAAAEPVEVAMAKEFPVAITFFTEISRGSLMLYINNRLILNETFKFVEKVGIFKTEDRHGRIDAAVTVATGPVEIRVEVDPRGGAEVVGHHVEVVTDGNARVLEVRFDKDQRLVVGLEKGDPIPMSVEP